MKLTRRLALGALWALIVDRVAIHADQKPVAELPSLVFQPCSGPKEVVVGLDDLCGQFTAITFIYDGQRIRFTAKELFEALR